MAVYYLKYDLQNGYIHNWLVGGPLAVPVTDPDRFQGEDFKLQIAGHYYDKDPGITGLPVEREPLNLPPLTFNFQPSEELTWRYFRSLGDHFVDLSAFYHTWHYLQAWAYAQVKSPTPQDVTFVLTTNGPADLWLNGEHVHRQEHFCQQDPHSVPFQVALQEGNNEILVRFEEVAARECPYAMALQIVGLSDGASQEVSVQVPTHTRRTVRRQMFERAFEQAYLEQDVDHKGNTINLRWADDMDIRCNYTFQVQDSRNRIYVEGSWEARPSASMNVGHIARIWEGPYRVVLLPPLEEYYKHGMRYQRDIPVHVLDNAYAEAPDGSYKERRQEALEHAAKRGNNVFAEIAKLALDRWDEVDTDRVVEAIEGINQRGDCSDFYMVGLLGMMYRYMDGPAFPEKLKRPLQESVLGFKYWLDEPGRDAMCYTTENHGILFHTCEILAGQLYPDRTFTNAEKTGQWHRQKGEQMALSWLHKRGTGGFREWDSNCYFEEDLLALSHLADLAENTEVRELAAVVMDKMFFSMAINSYKGAFGSTHGRTSAPMIKSAQLESTSGISRLMWGTGVFNQHILGTVSLACSAYELPPLISDIAVDLPEEMWNRERHAGDAEGWKASGSLGPEVNKVTYKTPDYMLCSAQDYHPGDKGYQQHIWQATLGPDAVVFVNHPSCMSEEGSHRPNFWLGNHVLPRVAQWKDVLIAIHRLPENDWMGFTHAYFPIPSFDEHAIVKGADGHPWAFVQKGPGYLALTAAQGLTLIRRGPSAYRELRSCGQHNVWLCHMGRAAQDGSFGDFQRQVLALDVNWQELAVRCSTLRGDALSFGWKEPFMVNGKEQPITGFKHYENPYCVADLPALQMEIRSSEYMLRLHFAVST